MRRPRVPLFSLLVALLSAACGGQQQPGPATPDGSPAKGYVASSLEKPIARCGPRDSYQYVAEEWQCPDGATPFKGSLERAAQSRSGHQTHPVSKHPVDTYEVPCSGGNVTVFIDMYACESRRQEDARTQTSQAENVLRHAYLAKRYDLLTEACPELLGQVPLNREGATCMYLLPASLIMTHKLKEAAASLRSSCSGMPPDSPRSDVRAQIVGAVLAAVVRNMDQPKEDDVQAMVHLLSDWCGVPPERVIQTIESGR